MCATPPVTHSVFSYPHPGQNHGQCGVGYLSVPLVLSGKRSFDSVAVCVDRHSGLIVAVTCLNRGLTGAFVAQKMLKLQWRPFGIPSVIKSYQTSLFVGSWFENLCAGMGIWQAFSQAYHHQANGRAERAGQSLIEIVRKIYQEKKSIGWKPCHRRWTGIMMCLTFPG